MTNEQLIQMFIVLADRKTVLNTDHIIGLYLREDTTCDIVAFLSDGRQVTITNRFGSSDTLQSILNGIIDAISKGRHVHFI